MNSEANNFIIDMSSVTCGAQRVNAYTPESYQEEINMHMNTNYSRIQRSYHYEHEYSMLQERVQGLERENSRLMEQVRKDEEIRSTLIQVRRLLNNANLYRANDLLSNFLDASNDDILRETIRPVFQRQTNHPPVNALIQPINLFKDVEEGTISVSSDDDSMPSLISVSSEEYHREQLSNPLDEPDYAYAYCRDA
jgi:phosphoglycerate-specific signal transduction histidine kinase